MSDPALPRFIQLGKLYGRIRKGSLLLFYFLIKNREKHDDDPEENQQPYGVNKDIAFPLFFFLVGLYIRSTFENLLFKMFQPVMDCSPISQLTSRQLLKALFYFFTSLPQGVREGSGFNLCIFH